MSVGRLELDQAWALLRDEPTATLLDVRTVAEWTFVGVPDLSSLGKPVHFIEWTQFPDGAPNPDFLTAARRALDPAANVVVICRSGARSQAAAESLSQAGFTSTHNLTAGFEGPLDADGHRSGGWKSSGLPWIQQ
jgi:rhodanese-related sulfurtransferase